MTGYIVRRAVEMLTSILLVSILIFLSMHMAPGGPLTVYFEGTTPSPEAIAAVEKRFHLDQPLPMQYLLWLRGVFTGDLGVSISYGEDVMGLILSRGATTALLVGMSMIVVVGLGVVIGIVSARHPGVVDRGLLLVTGTATAVPPYIAAVVLISVFAVTLGWFPSFGNGMTPLSQIHHLILPALALGAAHMGQVARVTRGSVLTEYAQPHVDVARGRGVSEHTILRSHVMKNSLVPIVTVAGTRLGSLIAGTTVVETAFGVSGLGSLLVKSVVARDFPVVQGVSMVIVVAFVLILLLVDVVHARIDPRLRFRKVVA